jgi:hypothetical protein
MSLVESAPRRHARLESVSRAVLSLGVSSIEPMIAMFGRPVKLIIAIGVVHSVLCLVSRRIDERERLTRHITCWR